MPARRKNFALSLDEASNLIKLLRKHGDERLAKALVHFVQEFKDEDEKTRELTARANSMGFQVPLEEREKDNYYVPEPKPVNLEKANKSQLEELLRMLGNADERSKESAGTASTSS